MILKVHPNLDDSVILCIQTVHPLLSDGHKPVEVCGSFPFPWTVEGKLWVRYSWDERAGAVRALRALRGLNGPDQPHLGPPHTPSPGALNQLSPGLKAPGSQSC